MVHHNAPSGRNDLVFLQQNLGERPFFRLAKMGLAFAAEDLADSHALALFNDFVEIHETTAKPAGQISADSALPDRHESGKSDIARGVFCQGVNNA